jgi:hypothetical protein
MGKDAPPDEEGDLGEAAGVPMNGAKESAFKKLCESCGCLPWFVPVVGVVVAAALLLGAGERVVELGGFQFVGSQLAIPGGCLAMIVVIAASPWLFRMKV